MDLYIANCTKQIADFAYRLPETKNYRKQTIPIGGQIKISTSVGGGLSQTDIDSVVDHHRRYGLFSSDEVDRVRSPIHLLYSVGRPIPTSKIERALRQNTTLLIDRGRDMRREAAVAANQRIEHDLAESEHNASLRQLEMEAVEEEPKGGYRDENGPPVGEGVRVSREQEPGPTQRRGPQRRKAA